jgi:hypothetical protein
MVSAEYLGKPAFLFGHKGIPCRSGKDCVIQFNRDVIPCCLRITFLHEIHWLLEHLYLADVWHFGHFMANTSHTDYSAHTPDSLIESFRVAPLPEDEHQISLIENLSHNSLDLFKVIKNCVKELECRRRKPHRSVYVRDNNSSHVFEFNLH